MWETLVLLPFYVVSWIIAPTLITPLGIIFQILLWIGVSFVILFMITILGWVIAKIATHLGRFKTLVVVLLFLGGFVGYMVLISQLENGITTLFEDPEAVAQGFGSFVPAFAFGKACLGDASYGSIFFLVCAVCFRRKRQGRGTNDPRLWWKKSQELIIIARISATALPLSRSIQSARR